MARARLQVAGEGDVRERRAGVAPAPEQLLADRDHVVLVGVERRVDDELLGSAEIAAEALHLGGHRLGRAPAQTRTLEPWIRTVDAAVRAAARRLHPGGAVPPGAGEHGGEVAGQTDLAEVREQLLHDAAGSHACGHPSAPPARRRPRRRRRRGARGGSRAGRWRRPGRRARCAPAERPRAPRRRRGRTSPCRCWCAARRRCRRCAVRGRRPPGARPRAQRAARRAAAGTGPRRRREHSRRRPPPPRRRRATRPGTQAPGTARDSRRRRGRAQRRREWGRRSSCADDTRVAGEATPGHGRSSACRPSGGAKATRHPSPPRARSSGTSG